MFDETGVKEKKKNLINSYFIDYLSRGNSI